MIVLGQVKVIKGLFGKIISANPNHIQHINPDPDRLFDLA